MKPTKFKGQNVVFGENQPEYLPLPALRVGDEGGTVITAWELSDEELAEVIQNRKVYISMLTFNNPLTPISVEASLDAFYDLSQD